MEIIAGLQYIAMSSSRTIFSRIHYYVIPSLRAQRPDRDQVAEKL